MPNLTKTGMVALAAAVALLALTGLAGAAGGKPSALAFTDSAGDAPGAPDKTKVAINGDAASGAITFGLTAAGLALSSADGTQRELDLWLNTDRNDSTGSPAGNEYALKPPVASLSCLYEILGYLWSSVPSSTSSKSPLLTTAIRFLTFDLIVTMEYLKSMHRRGVPNSNLLWCL